MTISNVAGKSADAFRTISEVAEALKLPQHVLRFWETRFTQIKPMKRAGGRRFYRPEDIELLGAIRQLLYGEGYTIKGVQRILREQGPRAVAALARQHGQATSDGLSPLEVASIDDDDPGAYVPAEDADVEVTAGDHAGEVNAVETARSGPTPPSPLPWSSQAVGCSPAAGALPPATLDLVDRLGAVLAEIEACRGLLAKAQQD